MTEVGRGCSAGLGSLGFREFGFVGVWGLGLRVLGVEGFRL